MAHQRAYFGEGQGLIGMDDVQCAGSESTLTDCTHTRNHNCGHSEDAGVTCAPGMMRVLWLLRNMRII